MKHSKIKFYPVLQPIAFLYKVVVIIRNWLFDCKLLPSEQFPIPVICVGNLAVGGTGKTPFIEYLIRMLSDRYRIAVLSMGYKRKTSGFVLANSTSVVSDIGDEACQIKLKFPQVTVAVDKNRRRGMRNLLAMPEDVRPQVVLLDDGFQHRYIKPSFSIVVTDYHRILFEDKLLPAGRLREPAKSVARADMVVISKCPDNISPADFSEIYQKTKCWIHLRMVHFTQITYQQPEGVFPQACEPFKLENIRTDDDILLITGIVNPAPLVTEIRKYSNQVRVIAFDDHHVFTKKDIQKMQSELSKMTSKNPLIFCTEKDAARIRTNPHFPNEWRSRIYYIPINFFLVSSSKRFEEEIIQHISSML